MTDNVPHIAISFKWARILDPTITVVLDFFWWIKWFTNLSFIVAGNNGFYVTHAAIAQRKSIPVKDFMEWVGFRSFRKVVIKEGKEAFTDFGFYISTCHYL